PTHTTRPPPTTAATTVAQNTAAFRPAAGGAVTVLPGATIDLGGTLAANALNLGAKVINISGTGVGGNGALINSNTPTNQINAVQKLVLLGDASIGGTGRWDVRGAAGATSITGNFAL